MILRDILKSIGNQNYEVVNSDNKILSKNFDQAWKGGIKYTPTNRKYMDCVVRKIILDSYHVEMGVFNNFMLMWFKIYVD